MNSNQIRIDYFSDILCVWAWITQRRIDELNTHFKERIEIFHQYIDIFGDTDTRINEQWASKGLYEGFGKHVEKSASPYEVATVNSEIWTKVRPTTSANAHMVIKAVEMSFGRQIASDFAASLRHAFFVEAIDIGSLDQIYELIKNKNLDVLPVKACISNGSALAALMHDYQTAKEYQIKGSPCFVMNEGRQILFGNVGYRVLSTNIEELLKRCDDEASWC